MKPVRALPLIVALATLLAAACSSKHSPSSDGDTDYVNNAIAALRICSDSSFGNTVQPDVVSTTVTGQAAALGRLNPPADLQPAHMALVESLRSEATALRGKSTIGVDVEIAARKVDDAWGAWRSRLYEHYGQSLFMFEGISMLPAFGNGDLVGFEPVTHRIDRWQLVAFKFPLDQTRDFIKRVVGLPGETIEISGGVVRINGAPAEDDTYAPTPATYTYGPKTVPADSYFVLGDNRNNSYDSHAWQSSCAAAQVCDFVPKSLILGVARADTPGRCASQR